MYRKSPSTLEMKPPDGPYSGLLVITDEEADSQDMLCWGQWGLCGICKRKSVKNLPFPQDKILSIVYTSEYHETTTTNVWFIPVPDQPLSSNCYYVIRAKGRHKGKACTCSREGDIINCCFRDVLRDKKPKPLNFKNVYQQVKIYHHHGGGFFAKSVAPDGVPPKFLRTKVIVDAYVQREVYLVAGMEAVRDDRSGHGGFSWFKVYNPNGRRGVVLSVGVSSAIAEHMRWVLDAGGWVSGDEREVKVERVEENTNGNNSVTLKLFFYVLLVEEKWIGSFPLKRRNPVHLRFSSVTRTRAVLNNNSKSVEIPRQWYNLIADLPIKPPPPLNPRTHEPVKPEDLSPLFPDELIKQETTSERYIDIPDEVIDVYKLWRPTPLIRAKRLEKLLDTPARIYYKYEGVSPAGSHKPNSAVPQAYYNAKEGVKNVVTETGAGQWGSSLAFASSLFGIGCEVWQVRASYDQKPYRRMMMQTWGAKVHPSPSNLTEAGRNILQMDPSSPGSLGIAISEAVEVAAMNGDTKYCLGSVLNHVLLHQTVIGEECLKQMEAIGETPDILIGCTGGGSNFAGLSFPFIREKLNGKMNPVIRAVEPSACPSLTKGVYAYDYGDTAGLTPLMKMHTLGHDFVPDPIHAGGLRYHGMAPLISHVYELGMMEAISIPQLECFQGAIQFARTEGLIPAPEPTHAIAATIREALKCRETGEAKVILTAMCGHGHFDLPAYDKFLQGNMVDLSFSKERIDTAMASIPKVVA
uniref:tryptophan synthase n=1 Tax=Cannabis sativa TaxID=3483 RepID=A0A803QKF7_CANSA